MESIIRTSLVIKEINANLVRKYMRNNEKSTKTEVARYTFLSLPTVSSIIDNLLEKNEVKILGQNKSSGGRRAMLYAINPICALCAIVYITPYAIEYFISDLMGKVLFDGHKDIEKGTHIENIRQVLNELFDQYKPIKAIGIGVPAVVKKGVPVYCPEIPEIIGVNIKELCQDEFGVKIYVDRDISAITNGYYLREMSKEITSIAYIYFPDFPGVHTPSAGFIANSQYIHGYSKFAGEIGFLPYFEKDKKLEFYSKSDQKKYIKSIVKIIATIACMINPECVILNCRQINEDILEIIKEKCRSYIPPEGKLEIKICKEVREYLYIGLSSFTRKMLDSDVQLIMPA